jgi:hypothetical protein
MVKNYYKLNFMNMKNYIKLTFFSLGLGLFIYGCQVEEPHKPYGSDGVAPGIVKVDKVINKPGGAVIYYTPPSDVDLLYVKASFKDDRGRSREVKVSQVLDSIVIQGFGKVGDYKVTLNAVDRGENVSKPTDVAIAPLTPPIQLIFPTLVGAVDFGGIKVSYQNPLKAEVSLNVLVFDESRDEFVYRESFFTSQSSGTYSFRGYKAVKTRFGVYVEDRWENVSDTIYFEVTPIPDDFLDKSLFSVFKIQGDKDFNDYGFNESQMWDQRFSDQWNCGHTDFQTNLPHYLTVNLGVKVKLSRFKLYQRGGSELYKHGNPKRFNVYGVLDLNSLPPYDSNDPNAGWTFLKECQSFKPSGLPIGQNTAEDYEFQNKGEDFNFDVNKLVEIKYIRIEVLENWGGINGTVIGELSFWGEISK